jgi:hypothetical protein
VSWEIRVRYISSISHHLESKLLKPGKRYVLGRKDTALLISSKKISREHVTFTLSEFPTSRVVSPPRLPLSTFVIVLVKGDPTFKPKAWLQNPRNKPITIQRGINLIILDPSSSTELSNGDAIHLVGGITVVFVTKQPRNSTVIEYVFLQDLLVSTLLQNSCNSYSGQRVLRKHWYVFGLVSGPLSYL